MTEAGIWPIAPPTTPVTLVGRKRLTGERLRFDDGDPGALGVTLRPAGAAPSGLPVGYAGSMPFTSAGLWTPSASRGSRAFGPVERCVPAAGVALTSPAACT